MRTYRLFFLDHQAHVRNSLAAEHPDDDSARAWALAQPRRDVTELWQADRVVARFEPETPHGVA
ncbi:MAG: hypothetical protein BGN86_11095 [Caulobacterales bacterium 68-7]|nr:hypothetical protein [Caulobacterales bacterium]OJU13591.1 MAG: hypothetical protein BGN86_11095 [Caulobacterales bacterium 68-7]